MDNIPIMGVVIGYFIIIHIIQYLENCARRKHEFKMEELRLSSKYIVEPLVNSLLSDLHNITDMDNETANRLVTILESIRGIINDKNPNLLQLNYAKESLKEILEKGNLAADFALKLEQLSDLIRRLVG